MVIASGVLDWFVKFTSSVVFHAWGTTAILWPNSTVLSVLKLKKLLLQGSLPSREEKIAKALRVIFQSSNDEGISEEEAYKIIGWCD